MDREEIESQLRRIKSRKFYQIMMMLLAFIGGMLLFYGIFHGRVVFFAAVGGIWLVAAVAVYTIGYMANNYKGIIESLLKELDKKGHNGQKKKGR